MLRSFMLCFCVMCMLAGQPLYAQETQEKPVAYKLSATKIAKYIELTKGQKRVLLIYTSWCPHCREKIPGLMDLERQKPKSIIAVSVDQNYAQFAQYAKRNLRDAPFRVIVHKGKEDLLIRKLGRIYNIKSWTSYPTLVFLNEDNTVAMQGNYTVKQASRFLSK